MRDGDAEEEEERVDLRRLRREVQELRLEREILETAFELGRGVYGSVRVQRGLVDQGFEVGHRRVARLMAEMGLVGLPTRPFQTTTDSNHAKPIAPNLLDREFTATRPNQKWVTDITYLWTAEGWLYLAAVIDLYSRRIVGWSTSPRLETSLCLTALSMALDHRREITGLTHHLDRGVQYASDDYQEALKARGITCTMSRRANCWDNAVAESFFGTLKTELIYRRPWLTRESVRDAIAEYIEVFHNRIRRHSTTDDVSPAKFEEMNRRRAA